MPKMAKQEQQESRKELNAQRAKIQKEREKQKKAKQNRLIIRNLVFDINEKHLRKLLSPFGEVKQISIPKNPDGKGSKGFAFVEYANMRGSQKAIKELNGKLYKGRPIVLDFSVPKVKFVSQKIQSTEQDNKIQEEEETIKVKNEEKEEMINEKEDEQNIKKQEIKQSTPRQQEDLTTTVFIRNLPINVKEEELYSFFRRYGKIKFAKVVKDKQTGSSKGTGFVKFQDSELAQKLSEYSRSYQMFLLKRLFNFRPDPSINLELEGTIIKLFPVQKRQEISQTIKQRLQENDKPTKKVKPLKKIKRLEDLIAFDTDKKRNIYLAENGYWQPQEQMHEDDQARFKAHSKEKIYKLKNPNNSVSDKRIILKFLDKQITEEDLRQTAITFLSENGHHLRQLTYCKLMLTDNMTKSAGFAFLQFKNHQPAVSFLQYLSDNGSILQKRPFACQFAIQDSRKLIKLKNRNKK